MWYLCSRYSRREASGTGLQSQKAYVKLRDKFANSIHLVQPDETLSYVINIDASGRAIGGVLMRTNRDSETHIVCTATRTNRDSETHIVCTASRVLTDGTPIFGC